MELVLKDLQKKTTIPINNSDEFEAAVISIMEEYNYTKGKMAKFFGINERAMFYKISKLRKLD